jgi:hypothetical protein
LISCNVTPGGGGWRGSPESGVRRRHWPGKGAKGRRSSPRLGFGRSWVGKAAGEVTRRRRVAPVAGTSAPAREVARLGHTQYGELE